MKGEAPEFTSSTEMGAAWVNVANEVPRTEAEGPGVRYALWVQGCPLRCKGCCNPHMLEDQRMELCHVDDVVERIVNTEGIEGVTFIGGEPFWQAEALAEVAREVRSRGLGVMVFSGLTMRRIKRENRDDWSAFLSQIDLLVDGPYIKSMHVNDRRWIGSSNQQVHFLTERYKHLAETSSGWAEEPNTIELRMVGDQISINGFPEESIVELSRASIRAKSK